MNRFRALKAVITLLPMAFLAAPVAMAAPPGNNGNPHAEHPHGNDHGAQTPESGTLISVSIDFGEARRLALSCGCTGYKPLPPGIAKNLARGKPLPPGIAKRYVPGLMLRQLPVYPGYSWGIYGTALVLSSDSGGIIAKAILNVFK